VEDAGGNRARRKGADAADRDVVSATCLSEVLHCGWPTKRHIHPNLIRPRKKLKQFLIGYPRTANFGATLLPLNETCCRVLGLGGEVYAERDHLGLELKGSAIL
jgi:hypothetical protein